MSESRARSDAPPLPVSRPAPVTADAFEESFGEPLSHTLDLTSWGDGVNLAREYARIEEEVGRAVAFEGEQERRVRAEVFPRLGVLENLPPEAGFYDHLTTDDIAD